MVPKVDLVDTESPRSGDARERSARRRQIVDVLEHRSRQHDIARCGRHSGQRLHRLGDMRDDVGRITAGRNDGVDRDSRTVPSHPKATIEFGVINTIPSRQEAVGNGDARPLACEHELRRKGEPGTELQNTGHHGVPACIPPPGGGSSRFVPARSSRRGRAFPTYARQAEIVPAEEDRTGSTRSLCGRSRPGSSCHLSGARGEYACRLIVDHGRPSQAGPRL